MIIRAVIIDDEQGGRDVLECLLEEFCPNVNVVGTADSISGGLEIIKRLQPNLVFLDIQMPYGSGFDLVNSIENRTFEVVFTTAYDNYAIQAIRCSALDYLLKPIKADELIEAVERVSAAMRDTTPAHTSVLQEQLSMLMHSLSDGNLPARVAIPTSDGMEFVAVSDIVRCEALANYTSFFFTNGEKLLVTRTLKDFDTMLTGHNFFRVHNTHLINLTHVVKYVRADGGYVVMTDGASIEVSRRRRDELLEKLAGQARTP